jgi:hypothetical protein
MQEKTGREAFQEVSFNPVGPRAIGDQASHAHPQATA